MSDSTAICHINLAEDICMTELIFRKSHEIVGLAVRVGSRVRSGIKIGDRVGVGAQIASCYNCKYCESDNENYCPQMIDTYVRFKSSL